MSSVYEKRRFKIVREETPTLFNFLLSRSHCARDHLEKIETIWFSLCDPDYSIYWKTIHENYFVEDERYGERILSIIVTKSFAEKHIWKENNLLTEFAVLRMKR